MCSYRYSYHLAYGLICAGNLVASSLPLSSPAFAIQHAPSEEQNHIQPRVL